MASVLHSSFRRQGGPAGWTNEYQVFLLRPAASSCRLQTQRLPRSGWHSARSLESDALTSSTGGRFCSRSLHYTLAAPHGPCDLRRLHLQVARFPRGWFANWKEAKDWMRQRLYAGRLCRFRRVYRFAVEHPSNDRQCMVGIGRIHWTAEMSHLYRVESTKVDWKAVLSSPVEHEDCQQMPGPLPSNLGAFLWLPSSPFSCGNYFTAAFVSFQQCTMGSPVLILSMDMETAFASMIVVALKRRGVHPSDIAK